MSALILGYPTVNAVVGMDATGHADLFVSGQCTFASPCHVWARLGISGSFTRIASVAAGTLVSFSGTLAAQVAGPRTTFEIQIEEDTVTQTSTQLGIGVSFLQLGDSTVRDYYTNAGTYTATSIGVSVKGSNLNDASWVDGNSASERSPALRVADLLAQLLNVTVGYHVEAHGGTELATGGGWDPTDVSSTSTSGDFLYNIKFRYMANSQIGRVHFVLADFGTNAIEGTHPAQAIYRSLCTQFAAWFTSDVVGAPPVFFHICGEAGTDYTFYDAVRGAVLDAVALGPPSYIGSVIYDQEYHTTGGENDATHPRTDAHKLEIGNRAFLAVKGFMTSTTAVRGPRIASATYSGSFVSITLDQAMSNAVSSALTSTAFEVTDNGTPKTINAATILSPTQIRLTMAAPFVGAVAASYASKDTAAGVTIPMSVNRFLPDGTTAQQPTEPFYGYVVSAPSSGTGHFSNVFAGVVR